MKFKLIEDYKYYNPTPNDELIDNCYLRALCKCYDLQYEEAQKLLPNGRLSTVMQVLNKLGYKDKWNYVITDPDERLLTPAAFAQKYPVGTYYCILDKTEKYNSFHMIAIKDGIIYDTSNCSNYSYVLYVWKIV